MHIVAAVYAILAILLIRYFTGALCMSIFPRPLVQRAELLLGDCREAKLKIGPTASPAQAGLIAALLTEIPASSDVVERGFVVYSERGERDALGVPPIPPPISAR